MAIINSLSKLLYKPARVTKPKVVTNIREGTQYAPVPFNPYYDGTNLRSSGQIDEVLINSQKYDADFSQAIWAVTRFSSTPIKMMFMTDKGEFDAEKTRQLKSYLDNLWLVSVDKPDINEQADNIIMELFMHGSVGLEVVLDNFKTPTQYVTVAAKSVKWRKTNGLYVPFQQAPGGEVDLNIPTFFYINTDKRPDQAVADSPLLSAVQAVTFKQQVINDVQRVIRRAGYPRHTVTILEDILRKNAPNDIRLDAVKLSNWLTKQKNSIAEALAELNPEDAIVMFDSVKVDYLSTKGGTTIDFRPIIEILDSQLTSALKVLPSILGKSTGGSSNNIASVEAMTFITTLTFLQERCDKILSQAYTLTARLLGMKGYVIIKHGPINLRPELELEPQRLAKQSRILQLQSYGHITDSEAALELDILHLPSTSLSGTGFMDSNPTVNTNNISPNTDPLGRSITGGAGSGDTKNNSSKNKK